MSKFKLSKIFTPKVLSGLAVVGTVATAILAAADGMSAKEHIDKAFAEYPEDREKTKLKVATYMVPRVGGYFIRSVVCAGGTITLIVVSGYMSGLTIAALTGTVSYGITHRDMLEREVSKIPGGKEVVKRVKNEMAKIDVEKKIKEEKEKKNKKPCKFQSIEETGNGNMLFVDTYSGRVFRSNLDSVEYAQCKFNDIRDEGLPFGEEMTAAMSYNELFDLYNLSHSHWGYQFGYKSVPINNPGAQRIEFENTIVKLKDMVDSNSDIYGEDVCMISIANGLYPETDWFDD